MIKKSPVYFIDFRTNPKQNILAGAQYLQELFKLFNGDLKLTLAAYNAGPEAAPIWSGLSGPDPDLFLEVIRFSQTSDYIRSIYEIYSMYRTLYGEIP